MLSRRDVLRSVPSLIGAATVASPFAAWGAAPKRVTAIGTRRELFVENSLVSRMAGGAQLRLHQPTPREISLVANKPWEGSSCAYMKV